MVPRANKLRKANCSDLPRGMVLVYFSFVYRLQKCASWLPLLSPSAPPLLCRRLSGIKDRWDAATCRLHLDSLLLSASAPASSLSSVCAIHCRILKSGSVNVALATVLIDTLGRCGDLISARKLFDEMTERDVPAWNAMLSAYNRNGSLQQASALIQLMFLSAARPNSVTLSILLQLCSDHGDESSGRCVHCYSWRNPGIVDTFFYNSLLVYYQKLGHFDAADYLFEEMEIRNIVTWNAMISGYAMSNRPEQAVELFRRLRQEGLQPDIITLETVLHSCARLGEEAIDEGQSIHALMVLMGFPADVYAENSLLLMYSRCGSPHLAHHLFDTMAVKNIVSWNILMNGYFQKSLPEGAVALFRSARSILLTELSSDLVVGVLNAAKQLSPCPQLLMSCHGLIVSLGFTSDMFVISSLISAYGEHMDATYVRRCFNYVFSGNASTVLWNTLLSVFLRHEYLLETLEMMRLMQRDHAVPDAVTIVTALSISSQLRDSKLGKVVHGYAIRNGFEGNGFVSSSLMEFYSRCLSIGKAWRLFMRTPLKITAYWNTMICGCSRNGYPAASAWLFHTMPKKDATAVVGVIEAISDRGSQREIDYIHKYAVEEGFLGNEFVVNSLISMHWKFGDLEKANEVFNAGIGRSEATWNVMMAEYSNHGLPEMAVSLFHRMKLNEMLLDEISFLSVLPACAKFASLHCAMWAHANILKVGCEGDVFVATSLSDTYAKCGELRMARQVFDIMELRTTATWNCMIQAYGMCGDVEESSKLFDEMLSSGVKPDLITFLALISSCSHAGKVEKGLGYHDLMTNLYSLTPKMEHYSCIVDLFGRRGLIDEAFEFLEKIPASPDKCSWGSILGACREEGKVDVALAAAERLFELDPFNYGYNILLSSILSESGRWEDAFHIRKKLRFMGHRNMQGSSVIEA